MIVKMNTKIGNQTMQIEFSSMEELHKFNKVYGGKLPSKCDHCGSENVYLSYMSPKGYEYYMVECGDCGASANFGILQDKTGMFWKGDKMDVFKGDKSGTQQGEAPQQYQKEPSPGDDSLPF